MYSRVKRVWIVRTTISVTIPMDDCPQWIERGWDISKVDDISQRATLRLTCEGAREAISIRNDIQRARGQ